VSSTLANLLLMVSGFAKTPEEARTPAEKLIAARQVEAFTKDVSHLPRITDYDTKEVLQARADNAALEPNIKSVTPERRAMWRKWVQGLDEDGAKKVRRHRKATIIIRPSKGWQEQHHRDAARKRGLAAHHRQRPGEGGDP
jgi:hypothetical protein